MNDNDNSTVMLQALIAGVPYPPPGITDTPANKQLWGKIAADIEALPPGVLPDVPHDWTDMPGDADGGDSGSGARETPQGMLAAHAARMDAAGMPPWATPSRQAAATVWERGKTAWPGTPSTTLTPGQWAAGRTRAFLALAAGDQVPAGYQRDHDLLPDDHPARLGPPA